MIVRRLALASLLFSPLAWGADAAPPVNSDVFAGAEIYPIKVSSASKRAGDSLKPPAQKKEAVDVTVELHRTFDENGQPHYQCDADHSASAVAGAGHDVSDHDVINHDVINRDVANKDLP